MSVQTVLREQPPLQLFNGRMDVFFSICPKTAERAPRAASCKGMPVQTVAWEPPLQLFNGRMDDFFSISPKTAERAPRAASCKGMPGQTVARGATSAAI